MSLTVIFYAVLGGVLPALLWVWFWNKEDSKHPEPKQLIIAAFLIGIVAVIVVIPIEKAAREIFAGTALLFSWAVIEETTKFVLAYFTVLIHKANDEPIDALIYMITVALGFAAAENTLFLIDPIMNQGVLDSIISGNFRFIGATLLHVLASSIIGFSLGLAFYKRRAIKFWYIVIGLILAIILHGLFNFFIIQGTNNQLLNVFAFVWIGLIILLIAFERVKQVTKST